MDRGAWWAIIHGVAESHTWLSAFTDTHTRTFLFLFSQDSIRIHCILFLMKYNHNLTFLLSHPISTGIYRNSLFSRLTNRVISWKKKKVSISAALHCNLEKYIHRARWIYISHLGPQPPFVILYFGTPPRITVRTFTQFMMCLWLYFLMSLAIGASQRMKISLRG